MNENPIIALSQIREKIKEAKTWIKGKEDACDFLAGISDRITTVLKELEREREQDLFKSKKSKNEKKVADDAPTVNDQESQLLEHWEYVKSAVKDKAAKPNKPITDGVDWKSVVEKLRDLASDIEDAAAKDTAPEYSNMRFALRAIRVIVMDLQDRKPKVDDYTDNGLLNIEKWAEFGLDPNGEQLVREWAETASNPKGEQPK